MGQKTAYCRACGSSMGANSEICTECGTQQSAPQGGHAGSQSQQKSPVVAVVLSLIVTGVGQIYLGKVARGLAFLFGGLLFGIMLGAAAPSAALLALLVPVASAIDAGVQASAVNRGA